MQKWQFLRLEHRTTVEGGLLSLKVVPQVNVLKDGKDVKHVGVNATAYLKRLGETGWELTSVTAPSGHAMRGASSHEVLWFKRPLAD